MADGMRYTGGCLCASVRYVSLAAPLATRVCWCRDCQYLAAGSGTVNVCFARESFSVTGPLTDYASRADSGNAMHRRFCPRCGTALFSEAESRPHLIFVRAGTLDDPESVRPSQVIWCASAPSWAHIDPQLPHLDGQPPPVATVK